ncbi:MAG: hypothetical protein JOY80_11750 [Candidatus Dormibacteraeota bacterium]|nr:hypothetical protein [Candidatus Dormibacteraeota bacterium]
MKALVAAAILAGLCTLAATLLLRAPTHASADGGADGTLFSLTNQDRASNGVGSVNSNGTLQTIGEAGGYNCGVHVNGRAYDMIERNYFSHVIQGCGVYVFAMMHAYGVNYQSAGENIGWVSNAGGGGSAASYINDEFMNSPDHRSNILNGNYTDLGVGSDFGASWSGSGTESNVWMFAEEFAQLGSAAPPPPPPPSSSGSGSRNSPAPAPPQQPPATATPAPTPTPTPKPTPTPIPQSLLPQNLPAPPAYTYPGLLPSTVESVLESFLIA